MRRAAVVLTTSVLTVAGMAVLAPPASAADVVPRDLTITVTHLGPEDRTCQIDADLYVPPGVTAQKPGPALLGTNGFGGTKADQADFAQGFGERGYVTLSYTGLGFVDGDTCPITLDDREHDGAAASPPRPPGAPGSAGGRGRASCCASSAVTRRSPRSTTPRASRCTSTR